jgi:hypothetical protein
MTPPGKNPVTEDRQQVQTRQTEQLTQMPVTQTGQPRPQGTKGLYPPIKATGSIPRMHDLH